MIYESKNSTHSGGGVSVLSVVQIVFIILKLVGTIDWSWSTVLIPLWISLGITTFVMLLWLLVIVFNNQRKHK